MDFRRPVMRLLLGVPTALVVLTGLLLSAGPVEAEAPFFYDDIALSSQYDPELDPLMRGAGLVNILVQSWSRPDAGHPRQALTEQTYTTQYRLQWHATLDPASTLLVELKASTKDRVVTGDYFIRSEYVYQGIRAPLWVYGGVRIPEKDDILVWAGAESMSFRLNDVWRGCRWDIPVALRGWAEIRHDIAETHPVYRLSVLAHNTPILTVRGLVVGTAMDMFFTRADQPHWILEGHVDYRLMEGAARLAVITGYGLDLAEDGEQRLSAGLRIGFL